MSYKDEFEIEEDDICNRFNSGEITLSEYNKEISKLQRDYRDAAEESAHNAYDDEMQNW